jgi:hypothetical protein
MNLDYPMAGSDDDIARPSDFGIPTKPSRIRKKANIEVELVLVDGTRVSGNVFIGLDERVQDLLNDPKTFFPIRLSNQDIVLINKTAVALCKPLDVAG